MKGNPKYKLGQIVKFNIDDISKEGTIYIVDPYGTFEDSSDVSYDILADDCLYKHIREDFIE